MRALRDMAASLLMAGWVCVPLLAGAEDAVRYQGSFAASAPASSFRVVELGSAHALEISRGDAVCRYAITRWRENLLSQVRDLDFEGRLEGSCSLGLGDGVIGYLSPDRADAPGRIRLLDAGHRQDLPVAEVRRR